jgi:hypothetical protein
MKRRKEAKETLYQVLNTPQNKIFFVIATPKKSPSELQASHRQSGRWL